MDFNTLVGTFALVFGLFTLTGYALRAAGKEPAWMFSKLRPMQRRFGDRAGLTIHFVAYVAIPLLAGLVFLLAGR